MKIINIKKFVRSVVILLIIIVGISLIITKTTYSHGEKGYKSICVADGDTLWSIAVSESNSNSYYKNKDIRYIINNITKENNLNSNIIQINQKLVIPTF